MLYLVSFLILAAPAPADDELDSVVTLLEFVLEADESTAVGCLEKLTQQARSGVLPSSKLQALRLRLDPVLKPILSKRSESALYAASLELATLWGDEAAKEQLRMIALDRNQKETIRASALETLAVTQDALLLLKSEDLLLTKPNATAIPAKFIDVLGRYERPEVAGILLKAYKQLAAELQPKAVGVLVQRPNWSKQLLAAIERNDLPASVLNVNHLRALLASQDKELAAQAKQRFGSVRLERDPQRDRLITQMRDLLTKTAGDELRGQAVFNRVCGQCHKIHGAGQEVGPDITSNGRASFDQLLSNVFDPSLVIGPGYQAVTVATQDGRVLTGLVAEDNEQRIVLKTQGGKVETIARSDIDEVSRPNLSLMPEGIEKQLTTQELADLFAFLVLDRPPHDPSARPISGTPLRPSKP
jgi:putative heme-binding domain-containing protein